MASLNTLRTRGGIIISIVIGIALLAFLLGDIGPRSCGDMSVGTINGQKIPYEEYYYESEHYQMLAKTMAGTEALNTEQTDVARDQAWQSLISKYAYRPGFKKLGLSNSETEQIDMVSGQYISPVIMNNFSNPRTGLYEPVMLAGFLEQMEYDPSGRLQAVWEFTKEQMNDQRSVGKYYALVQKAMFVNDLEIEAGVVATNTASDISILAKPYSSVPDSTVTVTMGDIKEYYNQHKGRYKQQPTREVEYVIFDLLPSDADYAQAEAYVETLRKEFAESDSPMQYALLNSQSEPSQMYFAETEIEHPIAAAVFNNPEGFYGPELSGDVYTMARQVDTKLSPETIDARRIVLPFNEQELADSLVAAIRQGADFEQLAAEYSYAPSAYILEGVYGPFNPEYLPPVFAEPLVAANVGDVVTIDAGQAINIIQLTAKSAPVRRAQIATIRYKVDPSSATQQDVYAEASGFLTAAAGSYDNFKKAATEGALSKRVARIRNTDRSVSGLEDSRELVRWAFDNKKGEVSDIMEMGGNYVIAALTEVRDDEYARPEDLVDLIRPIVLRDKKADIIVKDIQGATLAQAAASMGVEPVEVGNVSFGEFFLDGVGVEPKVIGAVSAVPEGQLSKPVRGETGVFVFEVTGRTVADDATPDSERIRIQATSEAYLDQRLEAAMTEAAKVKDNRVKYF